MDFLTSDVLAPLAHFLGSVPLPVFLAAQAVGGTAVAFLATRRPRGAR
jgi:hypothetical protein